MNNYKIVAPEHYTPEHISYINEYKHMVKVFSEQTDMMLIIRDVNLRGIIGTDASAKTLGLKSGLEFSGKLVSELPCTSVAQHSSQFEQQNKNFLQCSNINSSIKVLNVFEYTDGLKARISERKIFFHKPSSSILGVISTAYTVRLNDFMNIMPNYILKFTNFNTIEGIKLESHSSNQTSKLTPYEQEICFLLLLGLKPSQIADFLNKTKILLSFYSKQMIDEKIFDICYKLGLCKTDFRFLIQYLISMRIKINLSNEFYSGVIGTKVFEKNI